MAKISALEVLTQADGTEDVPVVKAGRAKRMALSGLARAMMPFLQNFYKGDKGDLGGNAMSIGVTSEIAQLKLASGAAAGFNTFITDGAIAAGDYGAATYYRKGAAELDESGDKLSADGVRLGLAKNQQITLEMFGAISGDGSVIARAANLAAMRAALQFDRKLFNTAFGRSATIYAPASKYYFPADAIDIKLAVTIQGQGGDPSASSQTGTTFIGPGNWGGFIVNHLNTIGNTTQVPSTTSGAGTNFRNIMFAGNDGIFGNFGAAGATQGTAVTARAACAFDQCSFMFLKYGVYSNVQSGAGGAREGQASQVIFDRCFFVTNLYGIWQQGADANIWHVRDCSFIANGIAGWVCHDFLGSVLSAGHFRDNGNSSVYFPGYSAQCAYDGKRYYVNEKATTDTTDATLRASTPDVSTLWTSIGAGAASTVYPDFNTFAGAFVKGGPVLCDSSTNQYTFASGYYGESGQPPFFWGLSCTAMPAASGNGDIGAGLYVLRGMITSAKYATYTLGAKVSLNTANAPILEVQNVLPGSGGLYSTITMTCGFDGAGAGVTAGRIRSGLNAGDPTTSYGNMLFGVRNSANGVTDLLSLTNFGGTSLSPVTDNTLSLGSAARRYAQIYSGTATINTSDEDAKQDIDAIPDAWLDAWADVEWSRYRFREAVDEKAGDARWHLGLVAQRVHKAFADRGIDAFAIGLMCFDEWSEEVEPEFDLVDGEGEAKPTGKTVVTRPAGSAWGLRYQECHSIEAAWTRRELYRLKANL